MSGMSHLSRLLDLGSICLDEPAEDWRAAIALAGELLERQGAISSEYTQAMIDSGAVPAINGIEDKLEASEDKDFVTFVYGLAQDAPSFQLSWDQALSPAQGDAMLANLDQIFIGEITPEQFAENMNATLGQ